MQSLDALLKEALQLSPRDRAWLANALNESLEVAGWTAEIDRRLDTFAIGGHAVDAEESLERVRQALTLHRSERGIR